WHAFLCLLCNRLPQYADSKTDSPCALREKDDNGGFKFVSNAFQIDPAPSNIDYLKKAIKTENAATVQCDAFQIEIFSQQEEPWCQQLVLLVAVASMTYQFVFSQLFFSLNAFSAGWRLEQRRRRSFN
ncbi:unnamed protein product, partial [Durusdinium trenchii]